jgi:hypothetical protein
MKGITLMKKLMHKLGALTAAALLASGLGLASAAIPASAAPVATGQVAQLKPDYCSSGVRIYKGASTSRTVLGLGYPGQHVTVYADAVGTYRTWNTKCYGRAGGTLWYYHKDRATGVKGYAWWGFFN